MSQSMSRVPRLLNAVLRPMSQVIDSGDTEIPILRRCNNACQYAWYIIHAASAGAEATALRYQDSAMPAHTGVGSAEM
jgi:hypothetical protein